MLHNWQQLGCRALFLVPAWGWWGMFYCRAASWMLALSWKQKTLICLIILICDEPIANVDEENAQIIVNFIRKYGKEKNKLVIVACHTAYFDDIAVQVINM